MPSVNYTGCRRQAHSALCRYAAQHCAECRGAINETQHNNITITLSVTSYLLLTECNYTECRYTECHGAPKNDYKNFVR